MTKNKVQLNAENANSEPTISIPDYIGMEIVGGSTLIHTNLTPEMLVGALENGSVGNEGQYQIAACSTGSGIIQPMRWVEADKVPIRQALGLAEAKWNSTAYRSMRKANPPYVLVLMEKSANTVKRTNNAPPYVIVVVKERDGSLSKFADGTTYFESGDKTSATLKRAKAQVSAKLGRTAVAYERDTTDDKLHDAYVSMYRVCVTKEETLVS